MKKKRKTCKFLMRIRIYWICGAVVLLLFLNFWLNLSARAALTITSPTSTDFVISTVSTIAQNTTTTIAGVEVSDDGTAGWEATIKSTHFTVIGSVYTAAGSNDTLSTGGIYDGTYGVTSPVTRYEIVITKAGAVGTSEWKWRYSTTSASDWSATSTTGSGLTVEKGITVTFGTADYVVDDEWAFGVDVFPYTGLYVTPSDITIVSGDTGVTKGTAGYLTGAGTTSDAKTIMTGAAGNSTGTYRQDEGLELNIHANSLFGEFQATATLTVL